MRIKEVAAATGLTEKAIRLYEAHGLISPDATEVAGRRFRNYSQSTVQRLRQIAVLRRAGFSLEEISALYKGPGDVAAHRVQLAGTVKRQQQVLAVLETLGDRPIDAPALAALLACAVREGPLPQPELSFAKTDDAPPLSPEGVWLWHGWFPWRLRGAALALALLLRGQPAGWDELCALCRERMPGLSPKKLAALLKKLQRRGVVTLRDGCYNVQDGPLDRYDSVYTAGQLMDLLAATQYTTPGGMIYTPTPPMSVSSQGPSGA